MTILGNHVSLLMLDKMADGVLLSPTFPPGPGGLNPAMMAGGGGFDRVRKIMIRKTVDYHCSVLRYLEVSE